MSAKKGLYGAWLAVLGIAVLIGLYTTYKLFSDGHSIIQYQRCDPMVAAFGRVYISGARQFRPDPSVRIAAGFRHQQI